MSDDDYVIAKAINIEIEMTAAKPTTIIFQSSQTLCRDITFVTSFVIAGVRNTDEEHEEKSADRQNRRPKGDAEPLAVRVIVGVHQAIHRGHVVKKCPLAFPNVDSHDSTASG